MIEGVVINDLKSRDGLCLYESLLRQLTGLHLDAWVLPDGTLLARRDGETDADFRDRLIEANGEGTE